MKLKVIMLFIAVFSFFVWGMNQEQEQIIEEVEVVNIEVPVRVFFKGTLVGGLEKNDFKLVVNGKQRPINAFFEVRKKIKAAGTADIPTVDIPPRLFLLIFNVSDFDNYLQKNIDYFFEKVIRPKDHLMVLTNNFFLNDRIVSDLEKEKNTLKKILELEARRIRKELMYLRHKLTSLLEDQNRPGDSSQRERSFIRNFLHYLKAFKKVYFEPQSQQYMKTAKYLKNQKIKKWVINFYQVGMFYYPEMLEDMISMDELTNFLDAYKELQKGDKEQVDNLSKLFFNSGATFHTQLMRSTSPSILDGYSFSPITLDSENILVGATNMTGGRIVDSNRIKKFVDQITSSEDIYYLLTYNPGELKGKNQQVEIIVNDNRYRVVYDDQKRAGDFLKMEKKIAKEDPQILVQKVSFENRILTFTISNMKLVPSDRGNLGDVQVKIKIMDKKSNILYARERKFQFGTKAQELNIKLSKIEKGQYDALVEVYDLHTDKNDLAIKGIKIR